MSFARVLACFESGQSQVMQNTMYSTPLYQNVCPAVRSRLAGSINTNGGSQVTLLGHNPGSKGVGQFAYW